MANDPAILTRDSEIKVITRIFNAYAALPDLAARQRVHAYVTERLALIVPPAAKQEPVPQEAMQFVRSHDAAA